MIYDLIDSKRQHNNYLQNLKLIHVPVFGQPSPPSPGAGIVINILVVFLSPELIDNLMSDIIGKYNVHIFFLRNIIHKIQMVSQKHIELGVLFWQPIATH